MVFYYNALVRNRTILYFYSSFIVFFKTQKRWIFIFLELVKVYCELHIKKKNLGTWSTYLYENKNILLLMSMSCINLGLYYRLNFKVHQDYKFLFKINVKVVVTI